MSGWMWCPGAEGWCSKCGKSVTGLWKYWRGITSIKSVCAECVKTLTS